MYEGWQISEPALVSRPRILLAAVKQKQAKERDRHILNAHAERNIDNLCEHPYDTEMQSPL